MSYMDDEEKWPEWVCRYNFEGDAYSLIVPAPSREEAQRRLYHIGCGQVSGEHMGTISAHGPLSGALMGLLVRVIAWSQNMKVLLTGHREP